MKTVKLRKGNIRIAAFTNGFVSYGINAYENYIIEVNLFHFKNQSPLIIYRSKKKPIFRNIYILSFLFSFLIPITFLLYPIIIFLFIYFEGAINFIRNNAWQQSVRKFNWINIFIIMILLIFVIIF